MGTNAGELDSTYEKELLKKVAGLTSKIYKAVNDLEAKVEQSKEIEDAEKLAYYFHDTVLESMAALRKLVDELESVSPKELWPFPSYGDLLFSVR